MQATIGISPCVWAEGAKPTQQSKQARVEQPASTPSASPGAGKGLTVPAMEGKLTKLVRLHNRIRNLQVRHEMTKEGKLVIRGFSFGLGGGQIVGGSDIDWSQPGRVQHARLELKSVEARDVLDAVGVQVDGNIAAPSSGVVDINWRGKQPTGPESSLSGDVRLQIGSGSFSHSQILSAMAAYTSNPALSQLVFSKGEVRATIESGQIRIQSLVLEGPSFKVLVEGAVNLKDDAMRASCGVWPASPAKDGNKNAQLVLSRAPHQFTLGGTLSKPRVSAVPASR